MATSKTFANSTLYLIVQNTKMLS